MYFCIRDDDTSFFTTPEELEQAYGEISKWGPISLAVVPFHRAGRSKSVPEKYRDRWTVHPLHENPDLVQYLRSGISKGCFEIMLHGYYHDEPKGEFEFARGNHLTKRLVDGKNYLENLLKTQVRVFVPPHNRIGRQGLRALAKVGLHLGSIAGVRSGWPVVSRRTWILWSRLRRSAAANDGGVPWILDLGNHREISTNPVTPLSSFQQNQSAFDAAQKVKGVFCLATHYWELSRASENIDDPPLGEQLRYFVERARSNPNVMWRSVGDILVRTTAVI